jgi:hypothetical protein
MVTIWLINVFVVATVVLMHYEVLLRLSLEIPRMSIRPRFRVLVGLLGSIMAHILEVWVFALAYYLMIDHGGLGYIQGNFDGSLMDCAYFSFTTYTTLGYGDIEPLGDLRFLAGLESLTGLVLITWTASFMFLEMQKFWRDK